MLSPAGGYEYVAFGDSMDGAGGLVSTVGDLALEPNSSTAVSEART
ncbi:hypothetical protein [Massilia phosphatilytica]